MTRTINELRQVQLIRDHLQKAADIIERDLTTLEGRAQTKVGTQRVFGCVITLHLVMSTISMAMRVLDAMLKEQVNDHQ
jgi:hypothetical protein